ncbi:hypothetical protein F0562_001430 [Nyssa sinensis]|uniref:BHLH domain-containing protein n=1 Tax=Nyssa sinensis TaxID=561372 RepID=A0A5J5C6G4_9ASTE|nr:hypothetical protein F0562_001430 [Nyssa sinensis]
MDSDLQIHHHIDNSRHHQQQQQMNSGLVRYRSAPSSYFLSLLNSNGVGDGGDDCTGFLNPEPSSPETERIFARLMSSGGTEDSNSQNFCESQQNSSANENLPPQFMVPMKGEAEVLQPQQQGSDYASASLMIYQSQSQSPLPNHNSASQMTMGGVGNSNLVRHSSSPAGLFSHINVKNGHGATRDIGNLGARNGANAEASFSSASRLKGKVDFSSGQPSSSGLMSHISEFGSKSMGLSSPQDGSFSEGGRNNGCYISGFPIGSWDDSAILSDNFLKELEDGDGKKLSGLNASGNQNGEGGNRVLSHHLSLPTSSAELSAMEKFLQFQDSVPCKIRAKRGFATHPRSIAERVRRTKISERMRKLQELVPNMDKQTNTADMLDLAVDYIKDLQKEVKVLSDNRAKCVCSNTQKS